MTLPDERYRAVKSLKEAAMLIFKRGKDRPSLTELRHIFRSALKHYPHDYDMESVAKCHKCRKVFEKDI